MISKESADGLCTFSGCNVLICFNWFVLIDAMFVCYPLCEKVCVCMYMCMCVWYGCSPNSLLLGFLDCLQRVQSVEKRMFSLSPGLRSAVDSHLSRISLFARGILGLSPYSLLFNVLEGSCFSLQACTCLNAGGFLGPMISIQQSSIHFWF